MVSTKVFAIDTFNPEEKYINQAAAAIVKGKLVIIPTETVYGVAANMLNNKAIERLYEIKQRPRFKPFSLHIDRKERVEEFVDDIPVAAYKLMQKFWPGPLTMILKAREYQTIGIRMPDNEIALRIIAKAGVPVACPSANLSGKPAPTRFSEAIKDLEGLVDLAIDAGETKLKRESTIVDVTGSPVTIVREGAIKRQDIENALDKKTVLFVCTGNSCRSVMAKALLEKKLREKNRTDVEVLSRGLMLLIGIGATEATKEVLKKEGIDVSSHISQRVTRDMLHRSDFILVMEKMHEEKILQLAPEVKNRVFLLKEFAKINGTDLDIPDPVGKPLEFYEGTMGIIKEAIEVVAALI